jgi:HlyD family secretion protein
MARRNVLTRYLMPLCGLGGLLYASYFTLAQANAPEPPPQQLNLPLASQYASAISGSGLIEANTRNIVVGSATAGVVAKLFVTEGDGVKAGAPLFQLDDRTARADVVVREAEAAAAEAELAAARVLLADEKDQAQRIENLTRGVSVSTDRIERTRFAVRAAVAKTAVAEAAQGTAQARLAAAKVTLEKLTVTAPVDGRILKINLRAGAFIDANSSQAPLIMGNDTPLYVRVSLDENDLWRLKPEQTASGALRGNRDISFGLKFVRLEPYVIPKKSLTGSTSERVDTRIIEVLYQIVPPTDQPAPPLYIGQQVDVFIKTER